MQIYTGLDLSSVFTGTLAAPTERWSGRARSRPARRACPAGASTGRRRRARRRREYETAPDFIHDQLELAGWDVRLAVVRSRRLLAAAAGRGRAGPAYTRGGAAPLLRRAHTRSHASLPNGDGGIPRGDRALAFPLLPQGPRPPRPGARPGRLRLRRGSARCLATCRRRTARLARARPVRERQPDAPRGRDLDVCDEARALRELSAPALLRQSARDRPRANARDVGADPGRRGAQRGAVGAGARRSPPSPPRSRRSPRAGSWSGS